MEGQQWRDSNGGTAIEGQQWRDSNGGTAMEGQQLRDYIVNKKKVECT